MYTYSIYSYSRLGMVSNNVNLNARMYMLT